MKNDCDLKKFDGISGIYINKENLIEQSSTSFSIYSIDFMLEKRARAPPRPENE